MFNLTDLYTKQYQLDLQNEAKHERLVKIALAGAQKKQPLATRKHITSIMTLIIGSK